MIADYDGGSNYAMHSEDGRHACIALIVVYIILYIRRAINYSNMLDSMFIVYTSKFPSRRRG